MDKCICKGNWRAIVTDNEQYLDKTFICAGKEYALFGVVHASDDYYYGMTEKETGKFVLVSCVGSLKTFGFELKENQDG